MGKESFNGTAIDLGKRARRRFLQNRKKTGTATRDGKEEYRANIEAFKKCVCKNDKNADEDKSQKSASARFVSRSRVERFFEFFRFVVDKVGAFLRDNATKNGDSDKCGCDDKEPRSCEVSGVFNSSIAGAKADHGGEISGG